ncbi:MAG: hypothetical protein AB7P00_02300 [Sandaracinaceae bacterium]
MPAGGAVRSFERSTRRAAFALAVLATSVTALGGCGGSALFVEPPAPSAEAWSYVFQLDEGLGRLEARVCFDGAPPTELRPIDASGRRYLRGAWGPVGSEEVSLVQHEPERIVTAELPSDACIRYVVDLEAAARDRGGIHGAYRIGDDLVASTAVWLWAPRHRDPNAQVSARFELPHGIRVSPLWARRGGRFRLDERAFQMTAYAAFGRFDTIGVGVPGACIRVSVLGEERIEMGAPGVARAFEGSAVAASMLFGRFPSRDVGVLAVPTPFSSTSPFGIVGRGTMPTVAILVGENASEERLMGAWVPVHEFSHLAAPYVDRDDAWFSEGLATYYQEVLRARGSLQTPEDAWTHLDDGFRQGAREGTGRSLAEESLHMRETAAYRRVYWAGAAVALIADVRMRRASRGRDSLDRALERLNGEYGALPEPLAARDALTFVGGPWREEAERALSAGDFPDLRETYVALGIERNEWGGVQLSNEARAARLRGAIMEPRADLAAVPRCR